MRAYHFIKYNDSSSLDNLIAHTDNNTILCFDFEDSIQDCYYPINTPILKTNYRNYFKILIDKCTLDINEINIGIRLNADSLEYVLDLAAIAGIKQISTIFLPKISNPEQILNLQNDLQRNKISCTEIIPVIETKAGLNNLKEILKNHSPKISRIAFGHCDYNFDNNNYPYFHQDSREYWTWITKIFESIQPYNLSLVNSPFLQLDNEVYFINMLHLLYSICGNNCSQIALTKKQAKLCNAFSGNKANITLPKMTNRLDLRVPERYTETFIESFEKKCTDKGFAITDDRTILSPQEYLSALSYRNKANFPEVNFTFVGGCFPVQGNLPFENLFHQLLKKKIENIHACKFNVNIIRYERFKNCLQKISTYKETKPIDILAFSVRPEPFLRLVKLYYKFFDKAVGRKRWSLNLAFLNKINPEKYDLLNLDTGFNPSGANDSSIIHKVLININYILGSLFGNANYALRKYLKLINEIINFSKRNNIQLVIIGPPMRTNTLIERFLSKKLDRFIKKSLLISSDNFISGSDLISNGKPLFKKNGIYANEEYHELIAERMSTKMMILFEKLQHFAKTGQTCEYEQ